MRTESKILIVVAIFFAGLTAIYGGLSHEWAGTAMLLGSAALGTLPGLYYYWWSHRMDPRPEDLPDVSPEEVPDIVAAFPDRSIWPFIFGFGCSFIGLAFVFGSWTAFIGFPMVISAVIGVIAESRRGGYV